VRESEFQSRLIKKLHKLFPGCVILKNDSEYVQGIPDLLVLFRDKWAMLEVKASRDSPNQPNQAWYIDLLNSMSFAAFIWPDNEEEILDALQRAFQSRRSARIS
jgi:hypothetical protein